MAYELDHVHQSFACFGRNQFSMILFNQFVAGGHSRSQKSLFFNVIFSFSVRLSLASREFQFPAISGNVETLEYWVPSLKVF